MFKKYHRYIDLSSGKWIFLDESVKKIDKHL